MRLPDRGDIVTFVCPVISLNTLLVLTSREFVRKTGTVVGCGVVHGSRGALTNVPLDDDGMMFAVSELVFTLAIKNSDISIISHVDPSVVDQVVLRLIPLLGGERFLTS